MKVYIFSKKHNKLKEINSKYLLIALLLPVLMFVFMSLSLIQQLFFSTTSLIQKENKRLKENLSHLSEKFSVIQKSLNNLYAREKELRIASDIQISNEGEFGTGGSEINLSKVLTSETGQTISQINQLADRIADQIDYQISNFNLIEQKIFENQKMFSHLPAVSPMNGIFSEHGFGMRRHPILRYWRMHEGVDILGNVGDPIFASGDGVVTFVGRNGGYGLYIEIDHGFGYKTLYGHLSKSFVKEGSSIKRFQKIAECGNTGLSSGPHLHYEVSHNGEKQDPVNYILN